MVKEVQTLNVKPVIDKPTKIVKAWKQLLLNRVPNASTGLV